MARRPIWRLPEVESEWLACLAGDWCEGNLSSRWWWQSLGKTLEALQVVIRAWLDAPEYVPAALRQVVSERAKGRCESSPFPQTDEANAPPNRVAKRRATMEKDLRQ